MEFFADDIRLTLKIIIIDMVLSADNAVVIGLIASQFDPKIKKKVLIIGTTLAVIFRIIFAVLIAYFLQFAGVRTFGGLLLFYMAWKLYGDILKNPEQIIAIKKKIKENDKTSYRKAIVSIIIADLTISFDNAIAVAGAAKTNYTLLIFGLTLSIIMMITLANAITTYIKENRWVGWLGILSLVWVASDLIWDDFKLFY